MIDKTSAMTRPLPKSQSMFNVVTLSKSVVVTVVNDGMKYSKIAPKLKRIEENR
jgi:hypothetical protein